MLLDDIIELATNTGQSITVLLRECVVLAHQIKNDRLKTWANKELSGYGDEDELPDYRVVSAFQPLPQGTSPDGVDRWPPLLSLRRPLQRMMSGSQHRSVSLRQLPPMKT